MIRFYGLLLAFFFATNITYAGIIYGTIKKEGGCLEEGTTLLIRGKETHTTQVQNNGVFSIQIAEEGILSLEFSYKGQTLSFEVVSHKQTQRYDLLIVEKGNHISIQRT